MSGAMWWSDVQRYAESVGVTPDDVYDMVRERAVRESGEQPAQSASPPNTGSPKCTHYQPLADCVWQGVGSNNGITCSDSGACVWTLRAGA
jgi:hypothetical protein